MKVKLGVWFLILVSVASHAEQPNDAVACMAYWQVKRIALMQDHNVDAAVEADKLATEYQLVKKKLLEQYSPELIAPLMHEAMAELLGSIEGDYKNHEALDARYGKHCDVIETVSP